MKKTKRENKTMERKIKKFKNLCNIGQADLKDKLYNMLKSTGYTDVVNEDGFLYAKGEHPVLLVAHMDTVHKRLPEIITVEQKEGKTIISSPYGIGGDDRCGIFMILEVIKDLKCSVIFTEDEERGGIGASKFCKTDYVKDINVNYIIEFDRANEKDAVFYHCDNEDFEKFVTEDYFETDYGSYTDICDIAPELGVAAVNFSCGYYKAHTINEYVVFEEMMESIKQAKKIMQKEVTEPFEYIEMEYSYKGYGYGSYGYGNYGYGWGSGSFWDDDDYDMFENGSFWGKYSKTKEKKLQEWYIVYRDEKGKTSMVDVDGYDEDDALLSFLITHENIPYKNVVEIFSEEEMDKW